MPQDAIHCETTITAPPERVWALITEAEHLGRWFGDVGAEIDLRPGGALTLHWTENRTVHGRIEAVEPHSRFVWRWERHDGPDGPPPAIGNSTLVEFTLSPAEDGTLLTVVESGFASLEGTAEHRAELFASHSKGWPFETSELADYAAKVAV